MKDWFVHCLVARAFIAGRTQLRWSVNHIKGNPQNNRIENLEWATPKEQHDHANATGLHAKGSKVPTAKLTERAVMELVSDLNEGRLTQVELAALYGVTQSQVSAVKSGRSWAHLTGIVFTPVRKKRSGGTAPPAGREWRICRDFPAYLVSSLGELWSSYTNQVTLGSINHSGYLRVTVTAPAGKATQRQLHILVAREFVAGESDENNEVNNKDTNKKKNHISNLEWMSNPEQQNHAIRSGVHLKPSKKVPPLG
jgi:hypothetical protein